MKWENTFLSSYKNIYTFLCTHKLFFLRGKVPNLSDCPPPPSLWGLTEENTKRRSRTKRSIRIRPKCAWKHAAFIVKSHDLSRPQCLKGVKIQPQKLYSWFSGGQVSRWESNWICFHYVEKNYSAAMRLVFVTLSHCHWLLKTKRNHTLDCVCQVRIYNIVSIGI